MGIADYFRQILGRDPKAAELEYLNKFISSGELQLGEVEMLLQGHPEAQRKRLEADTSALSGKLAQGDRDFTTQAVQDINAQFAGLGRQNSSGVEGALSRALSQRAGQRSDMLASFYGGGVSNIANAYAQRGQDAMQRGYDVRDSNIDFARQQSLASQQNALYQSYMNQQQSAARRRMLGQLGGMALGAGAGAMLGPAGGQFGAAMLGGQFGGAAGGNIGGLF